MTSEIIADTVRQYLPFKRKTTNKGWISFNCPMCHHNGEPTPDNKQRGNIIFSGPAFTYRCFRCQYKAIYKPGMFLTKKTRKLLSNLGVTDEDLKNLTFEALKIRDEYEGDVNFQHFFEDPVPVFNRIIQPKKWKHLVNDFDGNEDLAEAIEYTANRGGSLLSRYNFYWSPDNKRRVIIPCYFHDNLIGYMSRAIDNNAEMRYYKQIPKDYIFNNHMLYEDVRYVILCEGPFDAMAINGVSINTNTLSENQIKWLKSSGKDIIILPDRDNTSLINFAIENGWYVSMPDWDKEIKDASKATETYGVICTVKSILDSKLKDETKIILKSKLWKK